MIVDEMLSRYNIHAYRLIMTQVSENCVPEKLRKNYQTR